MQSGAEFLVSGMSGFDAKVEELTGVSESGPDSRPTNHNPMNECVGLLAQTEKRAQTDRPPLADVHACRAIARSTISPII